MSETVRRPWKTAKYLLLGIALTALIGVVCFFGGRISASNAAPETKLDAVVLETQLTQIAELASVRYAYTNMAQFENASLFYGVKLPFTTKSFILTYDGVIKAGVNLSQAKIAVQDTMVTVTLPEAAVLSHEIDEGSMEVFDEKTSIFNPFTVEDFNAFQADQKAAMEEKALRRGLLEEAGTQAAASVRALLVPSMPDGWTLRVQ